MPRCAYGCHPLAASSTRAAGRGWRWWLTLAGLGLGLLAWPPAAAPAGEAGGITVTYLANEGFLVESGETRVLVDGLFGDGLRGYPVVPRDLRAELEAARGRFAGIDLVLASHYHGDHFDAAAVARHLEANPEALFLSTGQAIAALREVSDELADGRAAAHLPAEGERHRVEHAGATVTFLNLHHGRGRRPPVENLGLVIELAEVRLLHVGDTEATAADLEPYRELLAGIDVALVPSWLLAQPAWRGVGRHLVVMHLAAPDAPPSWFGPSGSRAGAVAEIRAGLPEAWVPLEPLASRRYLP